MPDRYRIRTMPRASKDIVGICSHIKMQSPQNAANVAQVLLDAIDSLERFPHRYKVHEHRKEPAKTVRSMPVPPFIVYYRVVEHLGMIEVLTVLHGHRKQPRRFK